MLTKELDHEDGDLTATQKAKRNVIMDLIRCTITARNIIAFRP